MALTFVTSSSALAGNPIHVTVYDGDGNEIDESTIVWSGLPSTCTVAVDTTSGGFIFNSTITNTVVATAKVGAASAMMTLTWKGLKFTSP